ncbi:MAG TPA: sugar phosphate isomerase/epimerase family protein [Bryobacteraceae bacterium]|nr:sugar phosphate isomerase/epimerase family protein [Bryobacteraceae bacterium]
MTVINRRQFAAAASGALAGLAHAQTSGGRFIKSICRVNFPKQMPIEECFRQAKNAGFDAIEVPMLDEFVPTATADQVKAIGDQAKKAGVAIAALWVSPLGENPLNHPDAEVRAKGVEAIRKATEFAVYLNCDGLLLVPGYVGYGNKFFQGYEVTYERITAELRKALPYAEQAKVVMAVENVGNRFLVSPLDARSFVDQFRSPWLSFFFDIGNILTHGFPQDWILTLGPRIKRLHAKNRRATLRGPQGPPGGLLEGDVDWKAVMSALVQVNYRGFISPEYGYNPDDPDQLKKLSAELDTILAMA